MGYHGTDGKRQKAGGKDKRGGRMDWGVRERLGPNTGTRFENVKARRGSGTIAYFASPCNEITCSASLPRHKALRACFALPNVNASYTKKESK